MNRQARKIIILLGLVLIFVANLYLSKIKTNKTNQNSTRSIKNFSSESFLNLQKEIIFKRQRQHVVFYEITKDGYGNRIYSLLSALMLAVLTDSALLINWPSIDSYIDCILTKTFHKFTDHSFLDFTKKTPEICVPNTDTRNTFNHTKKLSNLKGIL